MAFKFGAVPFHMWVPDVYQGAPTSVTLYHRHGLEARLVRADRCACWRTGWRACRPMWTQMLMALAVLSLLVGNVVAIAQTNLKRMLAYSAIANVGFMLLGFVTGHAAGYQAALNFTLAYVLTTLGVLRHDPDAAAAAASSTTSSTTSRGCQRRDPLLAAADAGADVLDRRRAAVRRLLGQAVDHPGAARQRHTSGWRSSRC